MNGRVGDVHRSRRLWPRFPTGHFRPQLGRTFADLKHHLHSAVGEKEKRRCIGHIRTGRRAREGSDEDEKNRNAGGGTVWARLHFIYRILSTAPYNRKWGKVAVCIFAVHIHTQTKPKDRMGLSRCLWVWATTGDAIWAIYTRTKHLHLRTLYQNHSVFFCFSEEVSGETG